MSVVRCYLTDGSVAELDPAALLAGAEPATLERLLLEAPGTCLPATLSFSGGGTVKDVYVVLGHVVAFKVSAS